MVRESSGQSVKSDNAAISTLGSNADWPSLIKAAGLGGPFGQLAQNAALLGIDDGVVRLALKPEFDNLLDPKIIEQMQTKLSAALGQAVKVRFEKASSVAETPADIAGRERVDRQNAAERALGADPLVQTLLRDFDARIVPASIKPV